MDVTVTVKKSNNIKYLGDLCMQSETKNVSNVSVTAGSSKEVQEERSTGPPQPALSA